MWLEFSEISFKVSSEIPKKFDINFVFRKPKSWRVDSIYLVLNSSF